MNTEELTKEEVTAEETTAEEQTAEAQTAEAQISEEQALEINSADVKESSKSESTRHANIEDNDLERFVEAMIFSSAAPIQSTKISQALNIAGVSRIKKTIAALNDSYEASDRSFRIRQIAGGYQFYVLPQWSDCLKKLFSKTRKIRLTKAALETMAVVAYKQPVSKNQIEFIRGVASDGVLHNLLEKSLIHISGRSEGAGRSLLYSATDEFLKFFGLNSFDDLPRIAEIEEMIQHLEIERAEANPQQSDGDDAKVGEGSELPVEDITAQVNDAGDADDATETSETSEASGTDDAQSVQAEEVVEEVIEEVEEVAEVGSDSLTEDIVTHQ